jgi:hypothetical protein
MLKWVTNSSASPTWCLLFAMLAGCGGPGTVSQAPPAYVYLLGYPSGWQQEAVYQYAIGENSALIPLSGSAVAVGVNATAMISDPSGHFVYVANVGPYSPTGSNSATITQFSVSGTGQLIPMTPPSVGLPALPSDAVLDLTVDPQGKFLYVTLQMNGASSPQSPEILPYGIGSDGTLTALAPLIFDSGVDPVGPLVIDPSDSHAYVLGTLNSRDLAVAEFAVDRRGTLSVLQPAYVPLTGGYWFGALAVAPNGQWVDVAVEGGEVWRFDVSSDGTLALQEAAPPTVFALTPRALYFGLGSSSAYLVDYAPTPQPYTFNGEILQYAVTANGAFDPYMPAYFSQGESDGLLPSVQYGTHLFTVDTPDALPPSVAHYVMQSSGQLEQLNITTVAEPMLPEAIAVVPAN